MAQTWAILVSLVILSSTWNQCIGDEQPTKLPDELTIPPTYSPLVRPNAGGEAVEVTVTAYISHIEFKEDKMDAVLYFRSSWTDARLKNTKPATNLTLNAKHVIDKIWTPDLFFPNIVEPVQVINRGFIRIATDTGAVLRSQMLKGSFSCPHVSRSAAFAPFYKNTTVNCTIQVESYGFSNKDIVVKSQGDKHFSIDSEAGDYSHLFDIVSMGTSDKTIALSTGNYSRISFYLTVKSRLAVVPSATLFSLLERRGRN